MANQVKLPNVVELNVGGTYMTTSLSTLTKYPDSMLAAMFSGRQPLSTDRKGRYFVDCDGDIFKLILEYLRFGSLPFPSSVLKVYEYARYFCLQSLIDALKEYKPAFYFDIITNIKENGDLAIYETIKEDIISYYVAKRKFALAITNQATSKQKSCKHFIQLNDYGDVFWYSFNKSDPPECVKAMLFDLENNGFNMFKGQLNISNNKLSCLRCQISANCIVLSTRDNKAEAKNSNHK